MAAPHILAHRLTDAHRFAQDELGVPRGYYRVVTSPSSIKGPRGADLYVVPGWERRNDRFSMKTALKFTRLNKIDVAEWRKQQGEAPVDERYPNDERTYEIAVRYNRLLVEEAEAVSDDLEPAGEQLTLEGTETEPAEPQPEQTDEPEAEEPKRRRRRCKECGVLVEPDEIEQHAADHLPSEE